MPSRYVSELAPPEDLLGRVRSAVARSPAPRTGTRERVAVALAAAPCVLATVLLAASHLVHGRPALRVDLATEPSSELLLVLLLVGALTLVATRVAVARGARGFGLPVTALFLVALLVAPIYAVLTLAIPLAGGAEAAAAITELTRWGTRCVAVAAAAGTLVLASFATALRRSAVVASRLRGAALGAASGAWAGLGVFLFCPATEPGHVLVGHVLPIAAFTLFGLAAGPRALRP